LGKIFKLPPEVVSKIAAGEIVESPASVVKELVENSIDALSSKIKVYIEEGGKDLIRVVDDGLGISLEDVELVFERHATSKITSFDDLKNLYTFGFRGEALHSIAEVSKVELITRAQGEEKGTRIVVEGGKKILSELGYFPQGTSITVRSLFYNIPLRRKLLRSPSVEWNKILKVVLSYILAFSEEVEFYLYKDGELYLKSVKDIKENLKIIFGVDFVKNARELSLRRWDYALSGFIALAGEGAGDFFTLVNRRPVRDSLIRRAIIDALFIPPGKFPVRGFIRIEVPPSVVDQNIHPAKLEVRFLKPGEVYSLVYDAVRETFSISEPTAESYRASLPKNIAEEIPTLRESLFEYDTLEEKRQRSSIRVLARSSKGYFIAETPDGIAILDPHAIAERLLFEKLKFSRNVVQLLLPVVIQLDMYSFSILRDRLPFLRDIGFEIEEFGRNAFILRGVPSPLADLNINWAEAIKSMVEENSSELVKAWANLACHGAPKLGDVREPAELQTLLDELASYGEFEICPHGRPLFYLLSYEELERWIRR